MIESENGRLAKRAGRPTKHDEETIGRLYKALADGLPLKSACAIAGIGVQTLSAWRRIDPELELEIAAARERFRRKALQTISQAIADGDWRAAAEALKMCFPEYRATNKLEVNAIASAHGFVLTAERLAELQERSKGAEVRALSQLSGEASNELP